VLGAAFAWTRIFFGYLVILPAHLSVSYSNDYFDVEVDRHGKPTPFSGGSGVLVEHPELRAAAKWIAVGLIAGSLALAVVFRAVYDFPYWYLGLVLLGNLLGWFYTAPPLRLAYRGLGELSTMVTAGFLMPGMGYLLARGGLDRGALVFLAPLILYGLAFILTVQIPDMEVDRLGGKGTWVARRGRGFGFVVVGSALVCATLLIVFIPQLFPGSYPVDFRVLGLMSLLPLAAGVAGLILRPTARAVALRLVLANMLSLAAFCAAADGYLAWLLRRG